MTKQALAEVMENVIKEISFLRESGQKEYSHDDYNAFANFDRVASQIDSTREKVLITYLSKHMDGIHAYVKGHRSQRESVEGRINDAIVYLIILRGMVQESNSMNQKNAIINK